MSCKAKPPRLLQIFNRYLEVGGEEISVNRIFSLLSSEDRISVSRCTFASASWTGKGAISPAEQAMRMFHNPAALKLLRTMHQDIAPGAWLVHNVMPVGSAAIYREALRQGVPVIYYIHNFRPFSVNGYLWACDRLATGGLSRNYWREIRCGAWQDSRAKTAWYAFILTLMHQLGWFRCVKSWIAISEFMRQKFIEAGIPAADIFTILHSFEPLSEAPEPRDEGYYVFLGRLIHAKGVWVLFDTWRLLREVLGDRTPRLIIAGDGPLAGKVAAESEKNRLIEYWGRVSGKEKHRLLAGCRAMIAPSLWWEPLGLVTYEAYDYGKPMLAARSGGLTETVRHGKTGFLHVPGNAEELARQILEIDRDPDRRIEMGRKGREWLLANTTREQWLRKFKEALEYALARKGD